MRGVYIYICNVGFVILFSLTLMKLYSSNGAVLYKCGHSYYLLLALVLTSFDSGTLSFKRILERYELVFLHLPLEKTEGKMDLTLP